MHMSLSGTSRTSEDVRFESASGPKRTLIKRAEVPSTTSAVTCRCRAKRGLFYGAAFAHATTRGLVLAILGQVTVLSLIRVTGILRGPQYPIRSTSFWLHSALHAAAVQSRRITRMAFSATPAGAAGPSAPWGPGGPGGPAGPGGPVGPASPFHRPVQPRQVPLSHNLMHKWTMQLRLRCLWCSSLTLFSDAVAFLSHGTSGTNSP